MLKGAIIFIIAVFGFAVWQATSDKDDDPNKLLMVEVNTSAERTGLLRDQLDSFEAANPGITVDVISMSWGQAFEKLSMMVAGGQIPDVIEMPDFWLSRFTDAGQIADLGSYIEKTPFDDDLEADTFKYGSINEKIYTIPYGYYLRALIYNKRIFKEAGIDKPPLTIDEFYETAKQISRGFGILSSWREGRPGFLLLADDNNERQRPVF